MFLVRISSFIFLFLACLVVVLGTSALFFQSLSADDELIVNGSFEDEWNGWDKYSLGRGYASLDPVNPYDGQYSLAIQGTPTPQAGTTYGSGVRQTIEGAGLPLDLELEFWTKPWVSGNGIVQITAMLTLYTTHQTTGPAILKIVYYVAWLGEAESWANIRPDEADYFVQGAIPFSWNHFQTSVKNDFESRWGDSTGYSLSKIVLTLEITVGYPATNTEYANWDDVSLRGLHITTAQTGTTSITTSWFTPSSTMIVTATVITTEAQSTTRATEESITLFTRPELAVAVAILIVAAISVAVIMLRRRRSNLPIAPSTQPTGKYCISCGAAMPLTAKYCPKCGSSQ